MKHISQVKKTNHGNTRQVKRKPSEIVLIIKYYLFSLVTEIPLLIILLVLKRRFGIENDWLTYTLHVPLMFVDVYLFKRFVFHSDEKYMTAVLKMMIFSFVTNPVYYFIGQAIIQTGIRDFDLQLLNFAKTSVFVAVNYIYLRSFVFGKSLYTK